jgi:hypothetical protein
MSQITVPNGMKDQFALPGPIPVFDESGKSLGVFLPNTQTLPGEPFWTLEELEEAANEPGGRTLEEIWKSLGAK